ncbi:MAG TPA: DUF4012 domain-containing protein [Aggregatilineales bacterium]|nr:DUF4012 domain-containing protein [Anaerolineales bacterium]HRE48222.1 DUF4012 domain-containing protein [Aggregatilineales bacterium]
MALTNEQFRNLISLLERHFGTESERRFVLETAFPNDPQLATLVDFHTSSAEEFTSALVTRLTAKDFRTRKGERALVRLLKVARNLDTETGIVYDPYIGALRAGDKTPDPDLQVAQEQIRKKRRRSPLRRVVKRLRKVIKWQVIAVILLLATVIPLAVFAVTSTDATVRVQESLSAVRRVMTSLAGRTLNQFTSEDVERIHSSLTELIRSLGNAKNQLSLLRHLAFLNKDLGTTYEVLTVAELDALAAQDMLAGLQPTLFFLTKGQDERVISAQINAGERIVELLQIGQGRFISAGDRLTAAQLILDRLSLMGVSPRLVLQIEEFTEYHGQLEALNQVLRDAPDLITKAFGINEGQNYLILSQNNDELRPSGGYISTYGWLRVRRFRITDYGYSATTDISPNPPADELASELMIPAWWIQFPRPIYTAWDGSWYVDFPSTAKMAAWFYDKGNNPRSPVNGVISIDLVGFEMLLEAIGPIEVPGFDQVVTAKNFRDVIYAVRAAGTATEEHKTFLAAIYKQILTNWQSVSGQDSEKLLNAALRAMREKHIMIYFQDQRLNEVVSLLGWSGAQNPGRGDYLLVADANMGNKSNSSIAREVVLDVELQEDGTAINRVAIAYDYSAERAKSDPAVRPEHYRTQIDYGNILQVFVPRGAQLTGSNNVEDPITTVEWERYTSFTTYVLVAYDTTERYQLSYKTLPVVSEFGTYKRYILQLQKQPGTRGDVTTVQVKMPRGASVLTIRPEPTTTFQVENTILEFRMQLTTDQQIEIIYH